VISSPKFSDYVRLVLREKYEHLSDERVDELAHTLIVSLQAGTPPRGADSDDHLEFAQRTRQLIAESDIHRDLEGIVSGEAARSDMLNTILTGVIAKVTLGQLKFGAYGLAMIFAPPLYFRWSNGREEKIRRTIDGILPDGPWSLSRLGWNFDWTESFESVALMVGLFMGLSALLSVIGYLIAPLLAPVWSRTGLPAMSLRRAVDASRARVTLGARRQALSPEVFASKLGDLAEMFSRSG
jgi:hypothetical protein